MLLWQPEMTEMGVRFGTPFWGYIWASVWCVNAAFPLGVYCIEEQVIGKYSAVDRP